MREREENIQLKKENMQLEKENKELKSKLDSIELEFYRKFFSRININLGGEIK